MKACDATTPYYQSYKTIISQLRCPVCGGQRIDSSNAAFAQSVKRDVCDYLVSGTAEHNIIAKVEEDYGQSLRIQSLGDASTLPVTLSVIALFALIMAMVLRNKRT